LEPDTELYEPLLKPLLDAPDSTYTLIQKSGIVWGHLEKVMSREYLPFQEAFDKQDPRLEQANNSLLLIANLGNYPKKPYAGFTSLAALVLYQFLSAVQTHSLIQRYGLVRMLIWVPDDERNAVLPRSISWRRKSSIDASISYENVVEVASSTRALRNSPRERHIEADVARKVFRKMEDAGLKTPPGRESLLLEELSGDEQDHNLKTKLNNSKYGKELAELAVTVDESAPAMTPETLRRMGKLKVMQRFLEKKAIKFTNLTDDYDAIMELQKAIYNSSDETEIASLKDDLDKRTSDWTESITDLKGEYQITIQQMIDNRLAVSTNPPTLRNDRRDYEPLRVHPADFYPAAEMCLLDFQPTPLWPVLRENLQENLEIYSYIVGHLFIVPTQSIRRGLNALAPGAFEWLIAECPSITNPNKGGSLDLDMMTVRRLTDEMIKEMVEAWVRWPWKPTRFELMSRSGAGVFDPDELETDGTDAAD
jgi:transcription factor 1